MFKPFKPFKPPLPRANARPVEADITVVPDSDDEDNGYSRQPPAKKRRIHVVEEPLPVLKTSTSAATFAPRKPLQITKNSAESPALKEAFGGSHEAYYMVLWRKPSNKKHKSWDGDGVLSVGGGYARLQDLSGREMGKTMYSKPLLPESTLSIAGKEIEVESVISKAYYISGKPFLNSTKELAANTTSNETDSKTKPPISLPKGKVPLLGSKSKTAEDADDRSYMEIPARNFYKSTAMAAQFKNPLLKTTIMPQKKDGAPTPRHDPKADVALVMARPTIIPKGKEVVDVVVDPFLGKHLLEHQREGVKFLYECVMGLRDQNNTGALLADEMGLGKTLMSITLIWTLLKQNAIYAGVNSGVIKKALIVCPAGLIDNWRKEFLKWLGKERIGVLVAEDKKTKLTDFTQGRSYSVMIIGYEKLRNVQDELRKGDIDIVVCDEGHRLKSAENKAAQAIRSLDIPRRVILSGTPVQNNLSEFFVMVDFINPGLLGNNKTFKKTFQVPIDKSRQPGASTKDVELGTAREEQLLELAKPFILRRNADVLEKYLPSKTEFVLFCRPTQAQIQVYQHVLLSPLYGNVLGSPQASLQLIMLLKKVCNSPSLVKSKADGMVSDSNVDEMFQSVPTELLAQAPIASSVKMRVLDQMLRHLSENTEEKIVIVSNYTSTLDILGKHLASMSLPYSRLDGSTPIAIRQDLVDTFNKQPAKKAFAFLLSAKAGGVGINLIGASRLVLFDVDWNPATDLQAMGRIHRPGQKRPVKIYRLLVAGGIDEKIYQRQVTKTGLADSVIDGEKNEASFSAAELRDLFRLDLNSGCQTHDLVGCDCNGLGTDPLPLSASKTASSTITAGSNEEESDDDFPETHTMVGRLIPGTKANINALEEELARGEKKKSKGKMQALMKYRHVDASIFKTGAQDAFSSGQISEAESVLGDEILMEVLREKGCKVGYIFSKKSGDR